MLTGAAVLQGAANSSKTPRVHQMQLDRLLSSFEHSISGDVGSHNVEVNRLTSGPRKLLSISKHLHKKNRLPQLASHLLDRLSLY